MKINITCYFATECDMREWMSAQQIQLANSLPKLLFNLEKVHFDGSFCARLILKPDKTYKTSISSSMISETTIVFTEIETNETVIMRYSAQDLGYVTWSVNVYE